VEAKFGYDTTIDHSHIGNMYLKISFLLLFVIASTAHADLKSFGSAVVDEVVIQEDFERPVYQLPKSTWQARQGTRWKIAGGVLSGIPSSAEYRSKKTHHRGLEPRLSIPATPPEYVAQFSIRFLDGEETTIVPFVEFGHHIVRLRFSKEEGVTLLVDYESLKVAEDASFHYKPGDWMKITASLKGDEFVIAINDSPRLYAKHQVIKEPAPSGGSGIGVAGPRGGKIEIDDLTIWTVKDEVADGWEKEREQLPKFEAVQVREKPKK
jgi:hypothetical protein